MDEVRLLASKALTQALERPIPARGTAKRGSENPLGNHDNGKDKKHLQDASIKSQPHGSSVKQDAHRPSNKEHPTGTPEGLHHRGTAGLPASPDVSKNLHSSGASNKHLTKEIRNKQTSTDKLSKGSSSFGALSKQVSTGEHVNHHTGGKMTLKGKGQLDGQPGKKAQDDEITKHSSKSKGNMRNLGGKSGKQHPSAALGKDASSAKHISGKSSGKKSQVRAQAKGSSGSWATRKHSAAMASHGSNPTTLTSRPNILEAKVATGQSSSAFSDYTKLAVIGGYTFNGKSLSRIEVFDLENEENKCSPLRDYPVEEYGMVAAIIDGEIMSCGGRHKQRDCYTYNPTKYWSTSDSMIRGRYHHTASLINNTWLLTGGDFSSEGANKVEKWTGFTFEEGPTVSSAGYINCQLTVNETHIFFTIALNGDSKLLNWNIQTTSDLPRMTNRFFRPSCGLTSHPENGIEAVIAENGKSEIFSFNTQEWKPGPDGPNFYYSSYTQLSDTFVAVGGFENEGYDDKIYKFDNMNYGWTLMKQHLRTPSKSSGIVTLPDNFVTCTEDQAFNSYTKLVVIGGYNNVNAGGLLSRVEVFDLEDASKTCNPISDYPVEKYGMTVGVIQGVIKSCGGYFAPHDVCYDYQPESNTWVQSASMMHGRYYHGASFIDNVWLISGGEPSTSKNTTEYWTGSAFEAGPDLQRPMARHCQLTLNATHVFFAEPNPTGPSYLLKWGDQTWTELPGMTNIFQYPSCGLISNPTNGLEAVVAQNGKSEIFNFNSLTWRPGPDAPYFTAAGYTPLSDTFVVVGGNNNVPLDTIYKFDNINYDWIPLNQHLQTAATSHPGVVTVPDSFVNCN